MGVGGAERDPKNEHVESEIANRSEHALEAAAMEEHAGSGGDGVGQGGDRSGDLRTLGLQRRGIFRGSEGDHPHGDKP